jgi:hypothetical protein
MSYNKLFIILARLVCYREILDFSRFVHKPRPSRARSVQKRLWSDISLYRPRVWCVLLTLLITPYC